MKTALPAALTSADAVPAAARAQLQADHRPAAAAQRQQQAAIEASSRQVAQRRAAAALAPAPRPNATGLPDHLKAGVENLSGHSLDDVQVHYNSAEPAALQAHAYAQGTDIHLAPGQEKHLPHEAWHVAQQKQGRVRPTLQLKGVGVNDSSTLENEADVMGRQAVQLRSAEPARVAAPQRTGTAAVVQRVVKIAFEEQEHEMEDYDTSTAVIDNVEAIRDSTAVAVENKAPGQQQRAHTTSNTVFTNMFVRELYGKTWVQAWQTVRNQYQFLYNLLDRWRNDATARQGMNATIRNQLPGLIQAQLDNCDEQLTRDSHPLSAPVWGARLLTGGPDDWHYYNHLPTLAADGVDATTHLIKPWKPSLTSAAVRSLETACQQWMLLRGQIPWTSVNTESYVTGDMAGPGMTEAAVQSHQAQVALTDGQADDIVGGMLRTFDFFPPSLTAGRTVQHAAAVAARHVVEHLQYHSAIKAAWQDKIAERFLVLWHDKIRAERDAENQKTADADEEATTGGKSKRKKLEPGRDTDGLVGMLASWGAIRTEYNRVYQLLKPALV